MPLLEIKKWHRWAREYQNRLQKYGETNKNGGYSSNPCRKGPLTLDARRKMLDEILSIQSRCNDNRGEMPKVDIINDEEELRICELIEAGTFPNKWTGDEANGADLLPTIYQDGSKQLTIFEL
jgi:DNA sulfur modification protein DndC